MDLYTATCYQLAVLFTRRYSTSFSLASRLFGRSVRPHIYAIYGLVRLADEIVDTYRSGDAAQQLTALQRAVAQACTTGYSANPLVHAFADTAARYHISGQLLEPFFASMRADLSERTYDQAGYERYIHGSAEVVGLMCLKVFVQGNRQQYLALKGGAQTLGAAYQKINFLRDLAADYKELGRMYFPGLTYAQFDEAAKQTIVADIERGLRQAETAIGQLPRSARRAVRASYYYYTALLRKLKRASAADLASRRLRISNGYKLLLFARAAAGL